MADRTCARCGARNRSDAEFCWQCYVRFGAPGRSGWAESSPERGAGGGSRSAPSAAFPGALRPLIVVAALAAVGAGLWFGWGAVFGKGFEFPRSLGGAPRLESEATDVADRVLDVVGDVADVDLEAAFYGSASTPAYSIITFEPPGDVPLPALLASLAEAEGPGATPPPVGPDGTVELTCRSFQDLGAECVWADSDRYVAVQGYGSSVTLLEPLARGIQAETA